MGRFLLVTTSTSGDLCSDSCIVARVLRLQIGPSLPALRQLAVPWPVGKPPMPSVCAATCRPAEEPSIGRAQHDSSQHSIGEQRDLHLDPAVARWTDQGGARVGGTPPHRSLNDRTETTRPVQGPKGCLHGRVGQAGPGRRRTGHHLVLPARSRLRDREAAQIADERRARTVAPGRLPRLGGCGGRGTPLAGGGRRTRALTASWRVRWSRYSSGRPSRPAPTAE